MPNSDLYKQATAMVLKNYATEKDSIGRSQLWKIETMNEDRKNENFNSTILNEFAREVESIVNKLEIIRPIVANLCKTACGDNKLKKSTKTSNTTTLNNNELPSVEPIKPASDPANPHGIDLDWN